MKTMKMTRRGGRRWISTIVTVAFIPVFLAQFLLFATPCYPESIDSISAHISTPEKLAEWLSRNITPEFAFGNRSPNTIQEILNSKKGNCEDFANLASMILKRMGIENKVVILKLKGLPFFHAVCIWKNSDGTYSFTSIAELHKTKETSVAGAIAKFIPECNEILNYSDVRTPLRRWHR